MSQRLVTLATVSAIVVVPSEAEAHLVTTGLGPFYDGVMHLLLSPADLLGLMAAVLLAGLQGVRTGRQTVVVLSLAWFAAGLIGLSLPVYIDLPWLSVFSFLIMGVLVAVNPRLPSAAVAAMAGLYGALHGLLNGSALLAVGASPMTIIGITVSVFILGLLCSAGIVSLHTFKTRIVARIAGSWIAAVGMLMFGWLVKGAG
jgi:hydrogenase/urease accessory protein HupE